MNRAAFVVLFAASSVASQQRTIEPKDLVVFNRSVSSLSDGTKKGLRLSESPGDGVAYLRGIQFANGTSESEGERLRRRCERAQSGGQPAERPHEGTGRSVGGERLRRGFR